MDDLVGGTICNGCGHDRAYAPGIGYFCRNDGCTYEKEQAKTMLRQMRPVDPRDARIQALETSLAEAEGRVIAEVVKWLRGQADAIDRLADEADGIHLHGGGPAIRTMAKARREAATALETGEWKK